MKKSNNKLIITAIVVLVILIIAIGSAYIYFTTDLFKGNEQLFFKYLAKNAGVIKQLSSENEDTIDNDITKSKHTIESEITFNMESNDIQLANQSIPAGNFNIKYSAKVDPENIRKSSETTLKYLTTDLFTLKYIRDNDLYAVKSDEVVNKYLTLDNNNLKEFANKLGIEDTSVIPNKIQPINFEELFSITKEQQKAILEKYLGVINTQISKDKYKREKNIIITVNDKNISTTAYSLELTQSEIIGLLTNILNTLKTDDTTLNIIVEKIKLLNANNDVTPNDIRDILQNVIDSLDDVIITEGETIKVTVYASNGELVRTEITGGDDIVYIDTEKNNTFSKMSISFEKKNEILQDNNLSNTEDISHSDNQLFNDMKVKKIEIAKQSQSNNNETIAIITLKNGAETIKVSLQTKTTISNNIQNDTVININVADNTYITAKINTLKTPTNDIEVEKLTKENSATINNFTPQYISSLSQAIVKRIQSLFAKKIEIVNTQINTQNLNNEQNNNMLIQDYNEQGNNTQIQESNTIIRNNTII